MTKTYWEENNYNCISCDWCNIDYPRLQNLIKFFKQGDDIVCETCLRNTEVETEDQHMTLEERNK